jgi:hypothetical protein
VCIIFFFLFCVTHTPVFLSAIISILFDAYTCIYCLYIISFCAYTLVFLSGIIISIHNLCAQPAHLYICILSVS